MEGGDVKMTNGIGHNSDGEKVRPVTLQVLPPLSGRSLWDLYQMDM